MWRGYRRVSRGSVFLLAMVALVCLLFLGTSLVQVAIHGLSFSSRQQKRAQALALAESGVEMALEKLYDNYDGAATTLDTTGTYADGFSLGGGSVDYVATAPYAGIPRSCTIRSTATTRTHQSETIRVVAIYMEDVDRVFQGAIFCNDNLDLKGGGSVLPDENGLGGSIYAKGFINFDTNHAYHMSAQGSIYSATDKISPWTPVEVLDENIHLGIAALQMPTIDLDYYRDIAIANGSYYNVPQKVWGGAGGSMDFTALGPVIFVEGNVRLQGTYTGNVAIVATGTITVAGNGAIAAAETDSLALISPKGIRIDGGGTVDGLIYSHGIEVMPGGVGAGGGVTIHGAIVADVVRTNGSIDVVYDDVWSGLPIPGAGRSQWAQISWEELLNN